MKKALSLVLLVLMVFACEDGVVITVPASSSYSFTIPNGPVNSQPDNLFSGTQTVDISQFFNEDAEQIESIKLDKLVYEVSGYDNSSGNVVLMDLKIQTSINGTTTDILVISGLLVENTGEIIAFEDGNPASALSAAQVASLESIMDNLQPFDLTVTADFTDDIDSDVGVRVAWDITASVSQETGG